MPDTLATLIELQRLKRLERTGWMLRGLSNGTESVAAHSFGVAVTAMLLSDDLSERGVEIDSEKLLRMALLHDWAESRVGDMPRTATDYFGADVRRQAEAAAFKDIVHSSTRYLELYDDYEHRNSLEAKLVKAADVIDLLIQVLALERSGVRGLDEFWQVAEKPDFQLEGVARDSVDRFVTSLLKARSEVVSSNQ